MDLRGIRNVREESLGTLTPTFPHISDFNVFFSSGFVQRYTGFSVHTQDSQVEDILLTF